MSAPNVDPTELAKFSDLAHLWWDLDSEFAPLHHINPLRLKWIQSQLPLQGLHGLRVADIGCGGGILSESMARMGAQVTGIDLAQKSLRVAQLHALEQGVSNVQYRHISAEDLAYEQPGAYDMVTCMEMLEHVPDPAAVVRACAQLVKPNGWVFFSTLNRNAHSFLLSIVGAEYILGLLPKGTHEYARMLKPSEISRWARQSGLQVSAFKGLNYNPINRRYALVDDVRVNYMLACQKATPCD